MHSAGPWRPDGQSEAVNQEYGTLVQLGLLLCIRHLHEKNILVLGRDERHMTQTE